MNQFFVRTMASLLVPCLMIDPIRIGSNEILIAGGHRGPPLQFPFTAQALALEPMADLDGTARLVVVEEAETLGAGTPSAVAACIPEYIRQARELLARFGLWPGMKMICIGPGHLEEPRSDPNHIPWVQLGLQAGAEVLVFEPERDRHAEWEGLEQKLSWEMGPGTLRVRERFEHYAAQEGPVQVIIAAGILSDPVINIPGSSMWPIMDALGRTLDAGGHFVVEWHHRDHGAFSRTQRKLTELKATLAQRGLDLMEVAHGSEPVRKQFELHTHRWKAFDVVTRPGEPAADEVTAGPADTHHSKRGWLPDFEKRAPYIFGGCMIIAGAVVLYPLMGGASWVMGAIGLIGIVAGRPMVARLVLEFHRIVEGDGDPASLTPEERTVQRGNEWRHFRKSIAVNGAITAFSLLRAWTTAWRPRALRYYPFDHGWLHSVDVHAFHGWLSIIDHSWVNDFLMVPAVVCGSYLAFTLLYAIYDHFSRDSGSLFNRYQETISDAWANHRRKLQTILFVTIPIMLYSGWTEKMFLLGGHVYDPVDIIMEGAGAVMSVWLILTSAYPFFGRDPAFSPDPEDAASTKISKLRYFIDLAGILFVGSYNFFIGYLIDPSAWTPATPFERYTFPFEVTGLFFLLRWAIQRNIQRPPEDTWLRLEATPGRATSAPLEISA